MPSTTDEPNTRLRGIIPVLPTPFPEDGSLDLESLDRLIEHALTWKAGGLAILKVASEVEKLNAGEYTAIAERAARKIANKVPLVVGVSGANTKAAAQSAAIARRAGAHAVFAKAPAASRAEAAEAEVLDYYLTIAQAADLRHGAEFRPRQWGEQCHLHGRPDASRPRRPPNPACQGGDTASGRQRQDHPDQKRAR